MPLSPEEKQKVKAALERTEHVLADAKKQAEQARQNLLLT